MIEEVKKLLANQDIIEDFVNRTIAVLNQENTVLPLLRKRFAETQKGIDNLVNAIQMGIISPSTKQRLDELEREKAELSVEIMKEEMARPTITKENILCYFEQFRKLNTNKIEHRRRLIDSFVNAIFLYDDKMVITFNYREQTKTITFADLEKSGIGSDINAVAAPINIKTNLWLKCQRFVLCMDYNYPIFQLYLDNKYSCREYHRLH